MNTMLRYVALCLMMLSFSSVAGQATGKIIGYIPYANGAGEEMFFIRVENHADSPACNTTLRFTMKSSDPKYQGTKEAVISAFLAGKQVHAKGTGGCSSWSNSEDLSYICLGDIPC